jgi:hypothetical protein
MHKILEVKTLEICTVIHLTRGDHCEELKTRISRSLGGAVAEMAPTKAQRKTLLKKTKKRDVRNEVEGLRSKSDKVLR